MADYQQQAQSLDDILKLFKQQDELAIPLATGQPIGLLQALERKTDWEHLKIFTGLLTQPIPFFLNPKVDVTSGYYGPIERLLNESGSRMDYLPANFRGIELYGLRHKFRVAATVVSPPDNEGYVTFGTHGAAIYRPFLENCRDPKRIGIAEINQHMPIVYGDPEYGDNKIHISELDAYYLSDASPITMPDISASEIEQKIADKVLDLIPSGATLQFGIGGIPDQVATLLAAGPLGDFGIHSELISDGFTKLYDAGKISNQHKGQFEGKSIFTFAFGHQELYDLLDERNGKNQRQAICLPVNIVNDPSIIARNNKMISINSGLMIDFAGQVCSEAIGLRQYSGVGGQLSFVQGAYAANEGKSILCIKSTAKIDGKVVSNILPTLPEGSLVSTPRHFTQYIVTEYGVADLYGVPDEKRAEKLIAVAHPDFRAELSEQFAAIKKKYYH